MRQRSAAHKNCHGPALPCQLVGQVGNQPAADAPARAAPAGFPPDCHIGFAVGHGISPQQCSPGGLLHPAKPAHGQSRGPARYRFRNNSSPAVPVPAGKAGLPGARQMGCDSAYSPDVLAPAADDPEVAYYTGTAAPPLQRAVGAFLPQSDGRCPQTAKSLAVPPSPWGVPHSWAVLPFRVRAAPGRVKSRTGAPGYLPTGPGHAPSRHEKLRSPLNGRRKRLLVRGGW